MDRGLEIASASQYRSIKCMSGNDRGAYGCLGAMASHMYLSSMKANNTEVELNGHVILGRGSILGGRYPKHPPPYGPRPNPSRTTVE